MPSHRKFVHVLNSPRTIRMAMAQENKAIREGIKCERVDFGRLYRLRGGICGVCRQAVSFETFTVDHIRPKSKGGPHCEWNLQLAHLGCNSSKSDKLPAQYSY